MMNAAVMISESQKKLQTLYMFFVWFKSAEYNGVSKYQAIQSLNKFMVAEMNWPKKKAAEQILDFFQHEQNYTPDQLIELYQILKE